MPDFLLLTHRHEDVRPADQDHQWDAYLARLRAAGSLQGGSAIGDGICVRKDGEAPAITDHLTGFIRVGADDLDGACALLAGHPVFEAGGTVEIRALPRTGTRREETMREDLHFEKRSFGEISFHDCAMGGGRFDDVDLSQARFTNVNLRGARFVDVDLSGVAIDDANIDGLTILGHDIQALIRAEIARR